MCILLGKDGCLLLLAAWLGRWPMVTSGPVRLGDFCRNLASLVKDGEQSTARQPSGEDDMAPRDDVGVAKGSLLTLSSWLSAMVLLRSEKRR